MSLRCVSSRAVVPARRRIRSATVVLLAAGAFVALLAGAVSAQTGGARVEVVEVSGVIDGTLASYVVDVVEAANADQAEVIVLQLDAHGAIGQAGTRVVEAVRSSAVPVVVWIGPGGARATGIGMHVAFAGHVLAAAPGTVLGAGTPSDLSATDFAALAEADEAALVELAALAGRDQELTRQAVRTGRVVAVAPAGASPELPEGAVLPTGVERSDIVVIDETALAERGVVDLVAASLPDVLRDLGGREVSLADGSTRTIDVDTVTATVRFNNLGILGQMLHAVANPTLAYLLIVGGALALAFEIFQPGFGVSGISGLALMAFGIYGLAVLPVSWLAFAVLLIGLAVLAADLAIGRLGVLTALGTAALAAGSWFLFTGPDVLEVPAWVIALVVISCVVFFVGVMTTVLRAQGNQAMAGAEQVIGETGVVRSMLNPEGHIFAGGALWRARAPEAAGKVKTGTHVRILGLNDTLTLDVEPIDATKPEETTTV